MYLQRLLSLRYGTTALKDFGVAVTEALLNTMRVDILTERDAARNHVHHLRGLSLHLSGSNVCHISRIPPRVLEQLSLTIITPAAPRDPAPDNHPVWGALPGPRDWEHPTCERGRRHSQWRPVHLRDPRGGKDHQSRPPLLHGRPFPAHVC